MPRPLGAPTGTTQVDDPHAGPADASPHPADATGLGDGRPRHLHPSSPVLDLIVSVRQWLFPLVVLTLGAGRSFVTGPLIALAVGAFIGFRIVAWRRFTYRIEDDSLRIEHGIFNRQRREIPIRRIQQVDLQRKLRHRVLGVAIVRIDTAGGGHGAEVALEALADSDALALRQALLGRRAQVEPAEQPGGAPSGPAAAPFDASVHTPEVVAELSTRQLAIAGMTGSRLAAFLPVIGAGFGLAGELPGTFAEDTASRVGDLLSSAALVAVAGLVAVPIVMIAAAATSILTDHEFTLVRIGSDLHLRRGLLDQREATLSMQRIQLVRVHDNPVRRRLGLTSVQLQSAGSGASADGTVSRLTIPYVQRGELDRLLAQILPGSTPLPDLIGAPAPARRRAYNRRVGLGAAAVIALALITWSWWALLAAVLLLPLALLAELAYRGLGHAVSPSFVFARRGGLVRELDVVPVAKTQSSRLVSTPFQRRVGLATLQFGIAGRGRTPAIVDGDATCLAPIRHDALYATAARADEQAVRRRTRAEAAESDDPLAGSAPSRRPDPGESTQG